MLINCTHMHDLEGDEGLGPLLRFESDVSPLSQFNLSALLLIEQAAIDI